MFEGLRYGVGWRRDRVANGSHTPGKDTRAPRDEPAWSWCAKYSSWGEAVVIGIIEPGLKRTFPESSEKKRAVNNYILKAQHFWSGFFSTEELGMGMENCFPLTFKGSKHLNSGGWKV